VPGELRIAFEEVSGLDPRTRNRIVGRLLVGEPDDRVTTLVSPGRAISLEATEWAVAQLAVQRQGMPSDDVGRQRLLVRLLYNQGWEAVTGWIAGGGTLDELPERVVLEASTIESFTGFDRKSCVFQERFRAGLLCAATTVGSQKTTVSMCQECTLPDDRTRCTALAHPEFNAELVMGPPMRFATGGLCDAGHGELVGDFVGCQVGGHACWRRDIDIYAGPGEQAPMDSAARLVDELAFVRMILRKMRIGAPGSGDLEIGARLTQPCTSGDDFALHLQALAAALEAIDARGRATADGIDIGERRGLAALSVVLDHLGASGHRQPIELLRVIPKLRNQAPAHPISDSRALEIRRFGIEPPILNWSDAWLRIADRTRDALMRVRIAILGLDPDI
jgi:hypothetical protein